MFKRPKRKVNGVFIHCSASDNPAHDNVITMDKWHKARGWSGVGYHFFIRKDGTLEKGRSLEKTPAAQAGYNKGTIAICLHGLDEDKFTSKQFKTLTGLCSEINQSYGGYVTFHGHNEVANKACPVFDYRRVLGLDSRGHLVGRTQSNASRVLQMGDKGVKVKALQTHLSSIGYDVGPIDGDFGPATQRAVFKFQTDNKLRV